MPRWWAPAAMRAADRLSVRYRETIGLVAGLESTGSRSGASVEVGRLTMSTACFEAPTLPSKRSGKSGCHGVATIHIDLAASHLGTFLPVEGDRFAENGSPQRSMMPPAFPKVKPNGRYERGVHR